MDPCKRWGSVPRQSKAFAYQGMQAPGLVVEMEIANSVGNNIPDLYRYSSNCRILLISKLKEATR